MTSGTKMECHYADIRWIQVVFIYCCLGLSLLRHAGTPNHPNLSIDTTHAADAYITDVYLDMSQSKGKDSAQAQVRNPTFARGPWSGLSMDQRSGLVDLLGGRVLGEVIDVYIYIVYWY